MSKIIKFTDSAELKEFPVLKSDSQSFIHDLLKEGRKVSLIVDVNATYSGYLLNGRTYPGTAVKAASNTWVDAEHGGISPYNLPILTNHNINSEPIGRVIKAEYHHILTDELWHNDWKTPATQSEKGSGYTRLSLKISDKAAVEKFLDKRYLTVSSSFTPRHLICSVCNHNLLSDRKICHESGKVYDDPLQDGAKLQCYYIAIPDKYTEVSVVNEPAQPHAVAEVLKIIADSALGDTLKDGSDDSSSIRGVFQLPKRTLNLTLRDDATGDITPLVLTEGQRDAIPSGSGFIRSSTKIVIPDINLTQSPKGDSPTGVAASDTQNRMSDEDFAFANIAKRLMELDRLASDADMADTKAEDVMVPAGTVVPTFDECYDKIIALEEAIADNRVTADQEAKLKSNQFCGSNRSFQVPDSAHVTAARKLIGRYKGSAQEKKHILNNVNRKAAKLGCESSSDTGQHTKEIQNMADANTTPAGGAPAKSGADSKIEDKSTAALLEQLAELRSQNKQLQADRDTKEAELQRAIGEITGLKDSLHKERCLRLATVRAVTVKAVEGKALDSLKSVEEYADTLKGRTTASVEDALKDESQVLNQKLPHLKGLPNFVSDAAKPEASTVTRSAEPKPGVTDSKSNKNELDL